MNDLAIKKTREALKNYGDSLNPGRDKSKAYGAFHIRYQDFETIAEAIISDHRSVDGHLRTASLFVNAGCAREVEENKTFYGKFIFEDGSSF